MNAVFPHGRIYALMLWCAVVLRSRAAKEGWSFAQMATQAYMDRVDLSAHGFYATPEITGTPGVILGSISAILSNVSLQG